MHRSRYAPAVVAAVALVASLARWALQGSHNVYTAFEKRFYVPDPDVGWRVSPHHPLWIGLEACAVLVALAIGLALLARFTRLRKLLWIPAVLSLALPIAAFASGEAPAGARDTLPPADAVRVEAGIAGALTAPAGHYAVVPHAGTAITAHLKAGGEAFDARFDHDLTGAWDGNPADLHAPSHAEIAVAASAVDTGVGERTKHAREGYLRADTFPRIVVKLDAVTAVREVSPAQLAFRAPATVELIGKTHRVDVTGTLTVPDAAALARLGLTGDVLLVQADFALAIHETALAPDAGDFDGDRLPIHVSLVLRRTP
ncbi:MAG: YceI family protein [Deltaproteobacteria bacterium]|nr:YceI family protein [Deltaproteobacteria bacterium]